MTTIRTLYYLPDTWDDFIGVDKAVAHFKNIVRIVRVEQRFLDLSTLLIGPPGTGKTALVRKLAQCLLCTQLATDTLDPCNACETCETLTYIEGNDDIFTRLAVGESLIDLIFSPIDCTRIKGNALEVRLDELKTAPGIVRLAHLEEVGCLGENSQDHALLVPMDDRGFIWIGTGMSSLGLSRAFLRRFPVKLRMSLPDRDTLALWAAKRCRERNIGCESLDVMRRLADRSELRPAYALQVVKYASTFEAPVITREMVEEHIFDFNE
jgi:hypothetical protein